MIRRNFSLQAIVSTITQELEQAEPGEVVMIDPKLLDVIWPAGGYLLPKRALDEGVTFVSGVVKTPC